MKAIKFNTVIGSIRVKNDNSLGLSLCTPELKPEEMVTIINLKNLALDATLEPLEEPIDDTLVVDSDLEHKSQSQRFRRVLYVLWKQLGGNGIFSDFYYKEYEKIIEYYKNKLEPSQ